MTKIHRVVAIVDSGLRGPGGHNLSYTMCVRDAFVSRGFAVEVLVNRGCPAELAERQRFRRAFTSGAYDHPLGRGRARDLAYVHAQAFLFSEELDQALSSLRGPSPELIFAHTVADFELLGWRRLVRRRGLQGHLALLLRQTPRYATAGWLRRSVHPYWRLRPACLRALRRRLRSRFLLCTDSVLLTRDYARVYAGPISTLPIPLTAHVRSPDAHTGSRPVDSVPVIGYLGDARKPKGFHLLPAAVRAVREAGRRVRFVVQCPMPPGGADPEVAAALAALGEAPEVTLVPEHLEDARYAALLDQLDVVLLPYVHASYREATSGVFTEALARGKPVVVPSEGWMAHELGASEAGTAFDPSRPEDMCRALLRILDSLDARRAAANERAVAWRQFHSPARLVGTLLDATVDSQRPSGGIE